MGKKESARGCKVLDEKSFGLNKFLDKLFYLYFVVPIPLTFPQSLSADFYNNELSLIKRKLK